MTDDYTTNKTEKAKEFLNSISPSMCLAKWFHVSMHLTNGRTHSCYHPPTHKIDVEAIKTNPKALHNTEQKKRERRMMLDGQRPEGCSYCWMIEDAPNPPPTGHTSDRHFRSSEQWSIPFKELPLQFDHNHDFDPSYLEVNFNQACNFKCSYCSPHLSTAWHKEIEEFGPYQTNPVHLDTTHMKDWMPVAGSTKDNAYVQAFWKWWPDLYHSIKVFRMTGGEPLMDKNTFKVLEYVAEHPKRDLILGITSNMCPPTPDLMNRFITLLKRIQDHINEDGSRGAIDHFTLYASVDAYGQRANYIRNGMDFELFDRNVRRILKDTYFVSVNMINTFNGLSVTSLKDYLAWFLDMRAYVQSFKDEGMHQAYWHTQRVHFDIPLLREPRWQTIQVLTPDFRHYMEEAISFMEENHTNKIGNLLLGFYDFEIERVRRNLRWMDEGTDNLAGKRGDFYRFFSEHDRRRQTDFLQAFPEMEEFWNLCKKNAE